METVKELVAAATDHEGTVLDVAGRSAPYTYGDFVPNVWKAGNLLGHYGVHPGASVTVAPGPKEPDPTGPLGRVDAGEPVLGVLGGVLVGATVRLEPIEPVDSRVLLAPANWGDRFDTGPSCSVLAYGGPPTDPAVRHFEEELWSENPTEPPEQVDAADPALADGEATFDHGELVAAAEEVVADHGLSSSSTVTLDAALSEPGAVVAGVLAPLVAGACVRLPVESPPETATQTDTALLVTDRDTEADGVVRAARLTQSMHDTRRA